MFQDWVVFGIVGAVGGGWSIRLFRTAFAPVLATVLLRRGKVKWAMALKSWSRAR